MANATTPSKLKVLVFAASLRAESLNRKLAALAARVAEQAGAVVDHATLRDFDVPLYDGELESAQGLPRGAEELRRRLLESDAFIISSPEYNAWLPGTLHYPCIKRAWVEFLGEPPGAGADRVDPVST